MFIGFKVFIGRKDLVLLSCILQNNNFFKIKTVLCDCMTKSSVKTLSLISLDFDIDVLINNLYQV